MGRAIASILTNNSAMIALQTLNSINKGLADTQSEISTGKSIATAKDNSAVWAISQVMQSDVEGFQGINSSLSLGSSTVSVARQAAETVTDLLKDIKGKVVAAQEDNVDRSKIQTDIVALRDQISSVVGAAQFNGLNLINGSITTTNSNSTTGIDVLSSLDRASDGTVSASNIGVDTQNLSQAAGTALTATATTVGTDGGTAGVIDANDSGTSDFITFNTAVFLDASAGNGGSAALANDAAGVDNANADGLVEGDRVALTVGSVQGEYIVKTGDTIESLAAGLKNALQAGGLSDTDFSLDVDTNAGELTITNNTNADVSFDFTATRAAGGLGELANIDVSTSGGASAALGAVENLIDSSIDAAAEFGSVQGRMTR